MTQAIKSQITVSTGTCGFAKGAGDVVAAFKSELNARNLAEVVDLKVRLPRVL